MTTTRRAAAIVGTSFIVAMVASLLGGAMVEGVVAEPDYLARAAGGPATLSTGVALELVNALAVVLIAVALYPIVKRNSEGIALGYVGFRIVEAAALVAAAIIPIRIVGLGRQVAAAEAVARSDLGVVGDQLLATRAWLAGVPVPLFFCLGAVLLYGWLIRSRMLPRFIPIWGLVGVVGIAAVNMVDVGTTTAMILALPIILNELFMGGWLLFRGFSGGARSTPRAAVPTD